VVTGVGQHKSAMEQKEQEKQPPMSTTTLASSFQICFFLFSSLYFNCSEGGRGMVGYHMGRCRLHRSYHANFIDQRSNNRGGEATGLHMHGKMRSKNDLYTSSDSLCDTLYTSWDTATISETCPTIHPEQPEQGTKRHKGGPTFWCTRFPIERTRPPKASYLSLD
jgi:hypothetical protein